MVLKETKPALSRLKAASAELNAVSDAYQAVLVTIEQSLQGLRLGLEVTATTTWEVPVSPKDKAMAESKRGCRLAFRRVGDSWRLVVDRSLFRKEQRGFVANSADDDSVPLVEASRETRIGAAAALLELIETLHSTVTEKTATLRQLVDRTGKPMGALR